MQHATFIDSTLHLTASCLNAYSYAIWQCCFSDINVRTIGRRGLDKVIGKEVAASARNQMHITLSLYLSILFTSSNLEERIFGGTTSSNSVTWKTVALTSFCKTAPAIGVEIMGVTEPTAFISPVSEPTKRCQYVEGETLSKKQ